MARFQVGASAPFRLRLHTLALGEEVGRYDADMTGGEWSSSQPEAASVRDESAQPWDAEVVFHAPSDGPVVIEYRGIAEHDGGKRPVRLRSEAFEVVDSGPTDEHPVALQDDTFGNTTLIRGARTRYAARQAAAAEAPAQNVQSTPSPQPHQSPAPTADARAAQGRAENGGGE